MKMRYLHHNHEKLACLSGQVIAVLAAAILFCSPYSHAQGAPPAAAPITDTPGEASSGSMAATMDSMDELNDHAKLSNGDTVSYRVVEEQQQPIILMVSDAGELTIPLVGIVSAKGRTCKEIAFDLKPKLEKQYFYHATVIIGLETLSTHPLGKVYLVGQVQKQGAIEIPSNEKLTVSQAVLLDGGLADFADKRRVKLIRKKPDGTTQVTIVDLVEILEKGHTDKDPLVQPEDTISVPQRLINF